MANVLFLYPLKKISFMMFSGGQKRKISLKWIKLNYLKTTIREMLTEVIWLNKMPSKDYFLFIGLQWEKWALDVAFQFNYSGLVSYEPTTA